MTDRYPILAALDRLGEKAVASSRAVDDALLGAIDLSFAEEQADLVESLLALGRPHGLAGLIARYHAFSPDVQAWLQERAGKLAGGFRACIAADSRQTRANAVELIRSGRWPELAHIATIALSEKAPSESELVDRAAEALGKIVDRFPDQIEGGCREHVLTAVREALAIYQSHRRPTILECAIRLADQLGDVLVPLIDQPHNPTGNALLDAATMGGQAARLGRSAGGFYYLALSIPTTRARFAGRIGLLRDRGLVIELIRQVHRVSNPEIAKGLALVRQMAFMGKPAWWEQLPDELAGETVRWIAVIGAEPDRKAQWLSQLAADGTPVQRSAAVEQLCRWRCDPSTEVIKGLLDGSAHGDPDSTVLAFDELTRRLSPASPAVQNKAIDLLAHPDERIRQLARDHVSQTSFDKFWTQYPRLSEEVREFVADKLRRVVPDLADRLAEKLSSQESADRLRALRIVDQCGLAEALAESIRLNCQDPDSHVRSAAIKLLAGLPGSANEQIARSALTDADKRVRANAVEALEGQRTDSSEVALAGMLDDPDNRIRANAIKALMAMDLASARASLEEMLADPSADHRLSALWVVEQTGWLKPAEQVLRLAREDGDKRVRRRALRALGQLRQLYRTRGDQQRSGQLGSDQHSARSSAPVADS